MGATWAIFSTIALAELNEEATSWSKFMKWLVADAKRTPGGPAPHHMDIAQQALAIATRAQDGGCMREALGAISTIVDQHLEHALGSHQVAGLTSGEPPRWPEELGWALLHAGEEGMRCGALWRDLDRIGQAFLRSIDRLRDAGMLDQAVALIDGLAQLTAVGQQLDKDSPLRKAWLPRCATALAMIEADNERPQARERLAERALAGWALACVAVDGEDWKRGSLFIEGRRCLGSHPPVTRAATVVEAILDSREPFTGTREEFKYTREQFKNTWRWPVTTAERSVLLKRSRKLLASLEAPWSRWLGRRS